jgi:hypothetical protein
VYHGVDVVPELVEAHARRFGAGAGAEARPAWSFSSGDAAAAAFADSGIPTGADLLMSRDALQHLPLALAQVVRKCVHEDGLPRRGARGRAP